MPNLVRTDSTGARDGRRGLGRPCRGSSSGAGHRNGLRMGRRERTQGILITTSADHKRRERASLATARLGR
eukprot:6480108-Pyramimonas_sp.AAC.1